MSSTDTAEPDRLILDTGVRRFAVAWRNRTRRLVAPVGVLDYSVAGYHFRYLPDVMSIPDFRPFIGFRDISHEYKSARLFPFFALRVMDPKRPDYFTYLYRLGLSPGVGKLDVLARSGGEQKGDSVSLAEEPKVSADGATESTFLVRGTRYAVNEYDTIKAVDTLRPGDRLNLLADVANETNPRAFLLTTAGGSPVGWVPHLLIEYARRVRAADGSVTVVVNNGPDTPWHMRLLVRMAGTIDPWSREFSGSRWPDEPQPGP